MSNDCRIVDSIFGRYVVSLLGGFSINNIEIKVGTISGYLSAVKNHYKAHSYDKPCLKGDNSDADRLLREQKEFEGASAE